jgi:hypothetical protein
LLFHSLCCPAANGKELMAAVAGTDCLFILLTRNRTFEVTATLVINSTKAIIGDPILLPTIDPGKAPRLLHGTAAGYARARGMTCAAYKSWSWC